MICAIGLIIFFIGILISMSVSAQTSDPYITFVLGNGDTIHAKIVTMHNTLDTTANGTVMRTSRAADSINAIKTTLAGKLSIAAFTAAAINTLYGYTPANGANYKGIADSGRSGTNYITGYSLNKVRDSIAGLFTLLTDSTTKFYNASGRIYQKLKVWIDTLSVSSSSGQSVDISSAGFSNVLCVQAIGLRNTGTVSSSPQISIKTYSTSAITLNITETNTATTTILGISVLSGLPTVFASTSGLKALVFAIGY